MLNSISVSRVQPLAHPSPTLKHACLLSTLGSVLTAFPSIQTNLNPDKSEAILFSTHQWLQTFPATPSIHISDTMVELSDQITSFGVGMDSNLTFNVLLTLQRCARPVIFISDHFDTSDARSLMIWLF